MSINDLLSRQENRIATFTEFQVMHRTRISFLNYYSLIHAIPNRYKENLTYTEISDEELLPTKLKKILKCPQKLVKCIYDTYINEMKSFPEKTYQKWKIKLNIDISKNDFLTLFSTMYACTKSTKLRDFQYRVLHSTLVTNDKLSMWGIINDESCSFCHNAPETIIHLLIECETSTNSGAMWQDIFMISQVWGSTCHMLMCCWAWWVLVIQICWIWSISLWSSIYMHVDATIPIP